MTRAPLLYRIVSSLGQLYAGIVQRSRSCHLKQRAITAIVFGIVPVVVIAAFGHPLILVIVAFGSRCSPHHRHYCLIR